MVAIVRRTFLLGIGAIAGGLAVGYYLYQKPKENPLLAGLKEGEASFSPWLKMGTDNQVTVYTGRSEMGQGVSTTLAALVAEELDYPLSKINVETGPTSSAYFNSAMGAASTPYPAYEDGAMARAMAAVYGASTKIIGLQATGTSTSVRDGFDKMRQAGAVAKHVLRQAAANKAGVRLDQIGWQDGRATTPDGTTYGISDLLDEAARVQIPQTVALKDPSQWTQLGKSQSRRDGLAKVTGAPIFGIDVDLPEMVFGTVRISPYLGSRVQDSDQEVAQSILGVEKVVPIQTSFGNGFGVIALNTWAAFKGAEALEVKWAAQDYPANSAAQIAALDEELASPTNGDRFRNDGNVDAALNDAPIEEIVSARYQVPFLAHATMEPMNATAWLRDGHLTLWLPTQAQTLVRDQCAKAVGIQADKVIVHTTMLGGGFGRRAEVDFAVYAALLAMETQGRPIKVTWTREEDNTHDFYRPAAVAQLSARIDDQKGVAAFDMRIAAPSVVGSIARRLYPGVWVPVADRTLAEGAFDQPYKINHYRVSGIKADLGVPVGFWRSVGYSYNCFFHECFLDEIAQKGAIDPIALRLELMADFPVARAVMEELSSLAQWSKPLANGTQRGVAFCSSFGSHVGMVVDVINSPDGVALTNAYIVADIGTVLDPGIVHDQLISGAIFGFSSALYQQITFTDGMVNEQNFYDYDGMRMRQVPKFDVKILQNGEKIGGVGEIGTPPAVAAVVNAVSRLNNQRYRSLPLANEVSVV